MNMLRTLLVLCFVSSAALAQEKTYFDSPFGAGGGYLPGWFMVDMTDVNKELKNFGSGELPEGGFFAGGGVGFVYIPFIPNVRIGGLGFGGSAQTSAMFGGEKREAEYTNSFGGFTFEYTMPFIRPFGLSAGVVLGAGESRLEFSKTSGAYDWNNIWAEIGGAAGTTSFSRRITSQYFTVTPTLNIDIPVYRLFSIRAGAGYALALGGEWKADGDVEIFNVPDGVKGGGTFFTAGILFGFFAY
ncbi:MAG: hypothetical protein L6Q47_09450 [Ignavibacteriaceae bacterium]|nr:hypothetical protein [Ignavibacteriaceae bacterium]